MLQTKLPRMSVLFSFLCITGLVVAEDATRSGGSCNSLKLHNLCSKKIKSECIDGRRILAGKLCANLLGAKSANIDAACVGSLQARDVCVTGTLFAEHIISCETIHATVSLSGPTLYTLGTPIPWDVIQDDPEGGISFFPTKYTAPVTGYYIASVHTDLSDLTNSTQILGTPVAQLSLKKNGFTFKEVYQPFLTFLNSQKAFLTTILKLNAGDEITSVLDVIVLDQSAGVIELTGTVVLDSGVSPSDANSFFSIHLLSEDCSQVPPCAVTCEPVVCEPCNNLCCDCDDDSDND